MGVSGKIIRFGKRFPVLIVGAGVGGFTAALSLQRAGIGNVILTKESKFTDYARSGVFIGGSSIRILDRLGLGPEFRSLGTPMHTISIDDIKGRNIISIPLDDLGTEIWTVPRADLQQVFLEALPPDSVHFSTKFRALRVEDSVVEVKTKVANGRNTQDGGPNTIMYEADFVIGADGNNSHVRSSLSRSAMTVPSGVFVWRAVVENRNLHDIPLHVGREIWGNKKRFGYARMNADEVVWWAVISDFHEVILRPFRPRLLKEFKDFPQKVLDLICATKTDRAITRAEIKQVWPEEVPWVDQQTCKIALVGDAGRPGHFGNFNSGHAFAVEDGYSLALHLAEQNDKGLLGTQPNLEGYAENREERMKMIRTYLARFDFLASSKSGIKRYLAKKLLQASLQRMVSLGSAPTVPEHSKELVS